MSENAAPSLLGKIAGYTEILAKDPRSTIFVQLSEAYRQMGMLDDALEIASKGVRSLPSHAPGFTALGRIQAQRGARGEAVAAFEKAVELDRENLAALKGLASLKLQEGDREHARLLLLRVAAIKPDDAMVQKTLRHLAGASLAPPSLAVEAPQTKSRSSSPSDSCPKPGAPISTPTIAELYIKQGFPKRAMKVYRDLLDADPHNETIRRKLINLKKSLDAAEKQGPREIPVADPSGSGHVPPSETPAPVQTTAPSKAYAEKLELWLTSIQKRREHVQ